MITSSPGFQLTGVATLCVSVSCKESTTRKISSKLRPVLRMEHAVEIGDLAVGIAEERQSGTRALRGFDVIGPTLVIADGIDRKTDHLDVALLELRAQLLGESELGRADRREVFGMREQ